MKPLELNSIRTLVHPLKLYGNKHPPYVNRHSKQSDRFILLSPSISVVKDGFDPASLCTSEPNISCLQQTHAQRRGCKQRISLSYFMFLQMQPSLRDEKLAGKLIFKDLSLSLQTQ